MDKQIMILVVDDDQSLRDLLCDLLKEIYPDCRIVTAENGLAGLEIAQQTRPDAIILDFNMPVMDGYQMALKLQELSTTRPIPLILCSSEDVNHPLVLRLRALCRAVLKKPFALYDVQQIFRDLFIQAASDYEINNPVNTPRSKSQR